VQYSQLARLPVLSVRSVRPFIHLSVPFNPLSWVMIRPNDAQTNSISAVDCRVPDAQERLATGLACAWLPVASRLRLRRHHGATPSSHFYYRQIGRRPTSALLQFDELPTVQLLSTAAAATRCSRQSIAVLVAFLGLWKQFSLILHLYNTSFCTSCSKYHTWKPVEKTFKIVLPEVCPIRSRLDGFIALHV